jgi:sugar phosphate permease
MPEPVARVPGASRVRYLVLAAACALAFLAYGQRQCFVMGAPEIKRDLELSGRQVGALMSAFLLAYGIFQIPSGVLGDRFGGRRVLTLLAAGSAAATGLVALAAWIPPKASWAFAALLMLRLLFGALQAGLFPAISRVLTDWMALAERASAIGSVWTLSRLGNACVPLAYVWLVRASGTWATPFVATAAVGLAWCLLFWPWFRDQPAEMTRVNEAELTRIASGRPPAGTETDTGPVPWRAIVGSLNVWALGLMYGCVGFAGNFFTNMMPVYLSVYRGASREQTAWVASLVAAAGLAGCLLGGLVSDAVIRATGSRRWGRRLSGCVGLSCAGLAFFSAYWVRDVRVLGALFCLTFFFSDLNMAPAWAASADVGERYAGTIGGAMNMTGQFTGAAGMYFLGTLLETGHADRAFVYFAVSYGLAALSWLAIDVTRPVATPTPSAAAR